MKNYIVTWNAGYGPMAEEIEANNEEEANKIVYEFWKEDAENNAEYKVVGEATEELRQDHL